MLLPAEVMQPISMPTGRIEMIAAQAEKPMPPPLAHIVPKCHPREPQVTEHVDAYFIKNWPFPSEKAIQKFRDAGFSRVTCCYYPEALDDRIHFACKLLTLLSLIDDLLEDMSFADGRAYNEKLMPIARGNVQPDRNVPVEWITYDLWESMRAHDRKLADEILEPTFTFMRAQTDPRRKNSFRLGDYLEYREQDAGRTLLSALMRFVMKLELTQEDLDLVYPVDLNCAKHISVVNDIYSWEKEYIQSQRSNEEGSVLCSSVKVMADEANVGLEAAKRILWSMCREWELVHFAEVAKLRGCKEDIITYCKGVEYQMSGNEMWSRSTLRYIGKDL